MKVQGTSGDDPGFVRLVSSIVGSLLHQHAPDIVAIIEIDNWFDHKWLNFSGKVLGAVGVWKQSLTIPPFHPNRIKAQTVYRLSQQKAYAQIQAPPLHITQPSSQNLNRKLTHVTDSGVFVWWSGNTIANAKGSLMAYIQTGTAAKSWYLSFDRRDEWRIHKTEGIPFEEAQSLLQSVEPCGDEPPSRAPVSDGP